MPNESYPHFSQRELASPDTGEHHMDPVFMDLVESLRDAYGKPMIVSSAYRTPEHNERVSSTGRTGPHTTGKSIDVVVNGSDALTLVHMALSLGFTGIGISQKGPHEKRFIHLDTLQNEDHPPRPWLWSY
tara:strand:+ start:283 stop:672 length:390 start_codon:yes stop_codon:yes gene_type:complete